MLIKKNLAIFDLDGTLYNTNMINYLSYKNALPYEIGEFTYDYYSKECNGRTYRDFLPSILKANDEEIINTIHKKKKENYKFFLDKSIENSHLINTIIALKENYYIALCTTASKSNVEDILNYYKRKELFDLILTYEDVDKHKPNPEIFLKAMKYFNKKNTETVIFGVEGARRTGSSVIIIDRFY